MNASTLRILTILLLAIGVSNAAVRSSVSSQFLARGEKAMLEIRIDGREPDAMPIMPKVKDMVIEPLGFGPPRMLPGRRLEYGFQYVVSSYEVGKHVIPAIEVLVGGVRVKTAPIPIEVFDPNDLEWGETVSKPVELQDRIRYASIVKIHEDKVYENQTVEAEMKIYIPLQIERGIVDWGVPEFERSGLAVWRFEPADSKGQVNLLGQPYVSLSYPTTMTAIRNGEVSIGPATVRITYVKRYLGQFGPDREEVQATLDIPELTFDVTPLPEGAPEGFDNAVGSFSLGTAIKQTKVTEGEPLAVDVVVTGTGNLDNLRSPKMIDESGWKVYESTQNLRGDERRNLSGTVVFSQFIRPLEMKTSVPPFRLVFFDPALEAYQTVVTEPIALDMIPSVGGRSMESSGPPQSMAVPVERMTDILGIVSADALITAKGWSIPSWLFHVFGGLVALGSDCPCSVDALRISF